MKKLPKQTNIIFSILSKGKFISERGKNEKYYNIIKRYFDDLKKYFLNIDYELETENGYFYFSKTSINEQDIERKLLQFEKFIDILDLFNSLENKLGVGTTFSIAKITAECEQHARLKEKLKKIDLEGKTNYNKMEKIIAELEKNYFIELYDDTDKIYIILDAYNYLIEIVSKIKIN